MKKIKSLVLIAAVLAILGLALRTVVWAAGSPMYFGACLDPNRKALYDLSVGGAPVSVSCRTGDTPVTWSSTELFGVTAGTGLTGGGNSGTVTISLDQVFRLPQGCADGQVGKWAIASSQWVCANDNDTITQLPDGASASDPSRVQIWTQTAVQTFNAIGEPTHTIADPGFTVVVPAGRAYYYQLVYSGDFTYWPSDSVGDSGYFYADYKAAVHDNGNIITDNMHMIHTGYRMSFGAVGGYWMHPYLGTWLLRLGEGSHQLTVDFWGYSDNTMNLGSIRDQTVQLMRVY